MKDLVYTIEPVWHVYTRTTSGSKTTWSPGEFHGPQMVEARANLETLRSQLWAMDKLSLRQYIAERSDYVTYGKNKSELALTAEILQWRILYPEKEMR